jgi:hypothetical protein
MSDGPVRSFGEEWGRCRIFHISESRPDESRSAFVAGVWDVEETERLDLIGVGLAGVVGSEGAT